MSMIASPLASLPPTPQLMPGGAAAVPPASSPAISGNQPGDPSGKSANGNDQRRSLGSRDGSQTAEEKRVLDDLKARDREVRNHENAHRAAGGDLVRGGSYQYQQGPDGKRYAIGGDVQIDTSPVSGDPAATVEKMRRVIAAALAPAEPSATDLAVAGQAAAAQSRARVEASSEGRQDNESSRQSDDPAATYRQIADPSRPDSIGLRLEA